VATDILGKSGRDMLAALVAGTRDPEILAELARGKLRANLPPLREALRGRFAAQHAVVVSAFCQDFFSWYNAEHRHSGIGLLTRPTSTMAVPSRSRPPALPSSPRPTPAIPSGSSANTPSRQRCRRPPGSTGRSTHRSRLSNNRPDLSHQG
jgi:hypothetical protein